MPDYLVRWEIEITADTPADAAIEAYNLQAMPDSTATLYDVLNPEDESLIEQIDVRKAVE